MKTHAVCESTACNLGAQCALVGAWADYVEFDTRDAIKQVEHGVHPSGWSYIADVDQGSPGRPCNWSRKILKRGPVRNQGGGREDSFVDSERQGGASARAIQEAKHDSEHGSYARPHPAPVREHGGVVLVDITHHSHAATDHWSDEKLEFWVRQDDHRWSESSDSPNRPDGSERESAEPAPTRSSDQLSGEPGSI